MGSNMKPPKVKKHGLSWVVDLPAQHGFKRRRRRCASEVEAKGLCKEWTAELANNGLGTPLDRADLDWLRYWRGKLSLEAMDEAVKSYSESNTRTLGMVYQEYCVDVNARAGRKEIGAQHASAIKARTQTFVDYVGPKTLVSEIGVPRITDWLNSLGLSPRSMSHHRATIIAMFRWAYKREYISKDLGKLVPGVKVKPHMPGIYTPEELRALLAVAEGTDRIIIALGAYAGLRTSEIMRIHHEDIKADELYVRMSKKDKDRWVKIEPVLRKYLPTEGTGLIVKHSLRVWHRNYAALCKKAGVEFVDNGLRHSFASHHLVHFGNAPQTATEMGHETPRMTFNHYRQAVTREQAREYWEV